MILFHYLRGIGEHFLLNCSFHNFQFVTNDTKNYIAHYQSNPFMYFYLCCFIFRYIPIKPWNEAQATYQKVKNIAIFCYNNCLSNFFPFSSSSSFAWIPRQRKRNNIKNVPIQDAEFPEITSCPKYPYNQEALQRNGMEYESQYRSKAVWVSNDTKTTPEDLYKEIITNISQSLEKITVKVRFPVNGYRRFDFKPWATLW